MCVSARSATSEKVEAVAQTAQVYRIQRVRLTPNHPETNAIGDHAPSCAANAVCGRHATASICGGAAYSQTPLAGSGA